MFKQRGKNVHACKREELATKALKDLRIQIYHN